MGRAVRLAGGGVRGDERHARRALAVRERDARGRGRPERRGDPGHDLEGNARRRELLGLFAAAAEDERVAALEPHDVLSLERALDDQRMDARLVVPAAARAAAHRDALGSGGGERQDAGGHELVVRDHGRAREEAMGAHRQELGIARARADQPDLAPPDRADSIDPTAHASSMPQRRAITRSSARE